MVMSGRKRHHAVVRDSVGPLPIWLFVGVPAVAVARGFISVADGRSSAAVGAFVLAALWALLLPIAFRIGERRRQAAWPPPSRGLRIVGALWMAVSVLGLVLVVRM
jgi:hypothetical protein